MTPRPLTPEDILEPLDPEQREVARALTGPVCVLAGAGTGKTRAITHRIAYGVAVNAYQPQSVLAVTFTARAAGEMRQRLRALGVEGVQAKTFHAAALRQLGYFWPEVVGGEIPPISPQKGPLVGEAARAIGLAVDRIAVRDLAAEIEWAKVSLVDPDDYAATAARNGRPQPAGVDRVTVAELMRAYEEAKTARVVLDFEDILLILADVMARHREVGDTIRRQYRHFVVDEYQDVSPLQQYLLDQWLGGRDELCVVGDPAQTIYSFAGATPRHLTGFPGRYPHATVVRLVRDYRSTPQVVALANGLMKRGGGAVELVAQRPSGPAVAFQTYPDTAAEAAGVADRIAALSEAGTPFKEIAVLYRTNGQSEAFEDALAQRGIAYLVRGGARFFDREEVKKAMVLLRGAAVTAPDDIPVAVREALDGAGWTEDPPAERGAVRERWDSLQAIAELADEWDGTLREFVDELDERASAQHAPSVDGVTLTTLHAAKGLEWDAVFIAGLSEGLMPVTLAETEDAIEEERRLLYVGITRAREHLLLSYARARAEGSRASRKRTRFLATWWPDDGPARPRPRPKSAAADLTAADLRLFESLKAWRLAHAEADGKPAFTVLVDASLAEIAQNRPATLGQLARVRGVGPTKLDRYGPEILDIVAGDAPRP